ncbi:hypothetical protein EZS27_029111 [termite gut metagenome]|jgi:hypothetical protein|uniref:Uncharacterized protein n=1 Tax=termite gut metagenome TaxID=433724 RepID=A0A5J4QJY9_9ZZZZ
MDKLVALVKYVLPSEIIDYFELIAIKKEGEVLHQPRLNGVAVGVREYAILLYLDELNVIPEEYAYLQLSGNGFSSSSTIKDFPLRDKKVLLHVLRRRWVDSSGKSYSGTWDLTAKGTRYSKELASFLKEELGYDPDTRPIS